MGERSLTLEELIALAQFNIKAKSLAFSSAYVDDSGTHSGSHYVVYAGVIASIEEWPLIQALWQDVLQEHHVKAFHATDFNCSQGEYEGWGNDKKIALSENLSDAVNSTKCFFVAYACMTDHFDKYVNAVKQEKGFSIAQFCLEMCTGYLMDIIHLFPNLDPMAVHIAKRYNQRGVLMNKWISQLDYPEYQKSYRLEQISFLPHSDRVPFQIADLAAYEYYKHLEGFDVSRNMRKSIDSFIFKYLSPLYYFSEQSVKEELELRHKFVKEILNNEL